MKDECSCDQDFRTAEDYRDHLPCRQTKGPRYVFANDLTPAQLEALAILAEECGEVVQRVGKVLRHGLLSTKPVTGETNVDLLEQEIGDICAILNVLNDLGVIQEALVNKRTDWKLQKFRDEPGRLHHIRVAGPDLFARGK